MDDGLRRTLAAVALVALVGVWASWVLGLWP
jgi:hypothetical protein